MTKELKKSIRKNYCVNLLKYQFIIKMNNYSKKSIIIILTNSFNIFSKKKSNK